MHRTVGRFAGRTAVAALVVLYVLSSGPARAEDKEPVCASDDRACMIRQIEFLAPKAGKRDFRDEAYRDLAIRYVRDESPDSALALLDKIDNPDILAQAMRGMGAAAADGQWKPARYDYFFREMEKKAQKLNHAPSRSAALIGVAAARASAADDQGARRMADAIQNVAVRRSAYEQIALVEAERGDAANALQTAALVSPATHRDGVYAKISEALMKKGRGEDAYTAANMIEAKDAKMAAIQKILGKDDADKKEGDTP